MRERREKLHKKKVLFIYFVIIVIFCFLLLFYFLMAHYNNSSTSFLSENNDKENEFNLERKDTTLKVLYITSFLKKYSFIHIAIYIFSLYGKHRIRSIWFYLPYSKLLLLLSLNRFYLQSSNKSNFLYFLIFFFLQLLLML